MSTLNGIQTFEDLELSQKKVFMRLDLNVPIEDGQIKDELRIQAAIPSIQLALEKGAKLVLCSHLGRPKSSEDSQFSLMPVAIRLSEILGIDVNLIDDSESDALNLLLPQLGEKSIALLENARFLAGEKKNDVNLSKQLAKHFDVFINDAFGASHRAHATVVGVPNYVSTKAVGLLMEKELRMLDKMVHSPERPFTAIVGGSKVSDKIGLLENLLDKVDNFIIGGAMAYTFLAAEGFSIGSSRIESDKISLAKDLMDRIKVRDKKILLPVDHIVVEKLEENATYQATQNEIISEGWMAVDIGPKTIIKFSELIKTSKTIFWNGPMGVYEMEAFAKGSISIGKAIASSESFSIIGGGDSAAVVRSANLADSFSHISTGGGASLEFLQGEPLPGIEVLR
ncbi:MAG: phosphoglycerate kinase [Bdellovibrionales bacterium]